MGAQAVRLSNVDIDNALKNKDFEVLFQPIFDLGNGALARMETFVRWRHRSLGLLPPGAFISFFESQGRMSELTRYVLGQALSEYSSWRGPYAPGFSVNLAYSDLSDESFPSHFAKLLRDHNFPAELVTLECPTPPVDVDLKTAAASFSRVSETGARLAIEVRSRANEFLKSVDPFPFNEIKTGGSAILRFARTVRGPGLSAISDLLDIANKANAAITAVGVEDQASLAALRGLGFTAAQGNHLAKVGALTEFRPGRVNEVRELLGLEPLSQESLAALFRTSAPEVRAAEPSEKTDTTAAPRHDDALVERLNQRVAQQTKSTGATEQSDAAKKHAALKSRKTAKTKVMAKKALEREARKAAAIARAKLKATHSGAKPAGKVLQKDERVHNEDHQARQSVAPRAWQNKLSEEFENVSTMTDENKQPEPEVKTDAPDAAPSEAKTEQSATPSASSDGAPAKDEPQKQENPTGESATPNETGGPAAPDAPDTPPPDLAEPAAGLESLSLSVKNVAAHLIPELKVGAPVLNAGPAGNMREPKIAMAGATLTETPSFNPPEVQFDNAMREQEKPARSIPEAVGGAALTEATAQSAAADEAGAGERAPRRRKKNFLTRKYRIWPDHFWPKSWKRSWRRRAAERAAREATVEASEAVAE